MSDSRSTTPRTDKPVSDEIVALNSENKQKLEQIRNRLEEIEKHCLELNKNIDKANPLNEKLIELNKEIYSLLNKIPENYDNLPAEQAEELRKNTASLIESSATLVNKFADLEKEVAATHAQTAALLNLQACVHLAGEAMIEEVNSRRNAQAKRDAEAAVMEPVLPDTNEILSAISEARAAENNVDSYSQQVAPTLMNVTLAAENARKAGVTAEDIKTILLKIKPLKDELFQTKVSDTKAIANAEEKRKQVIHQLQDDPVASNALNAKINQLQSEIKAAKIEYDATYLAEKQALNEHDFNRKEMILRISSGANDKHLPRLRNATKKLNENTSKYISNTNNVEKKISDLQSQLKIIDPSTPDVKLADDRSEILKREFASRENLDEAILQLQKKLELDADAARKNKQLEAARKTLVESDNPNRAQRAIKTKLDPALTPLEQAKTAIANFKTAENIAKEDRKNAIVAYDKTIEAIKSLKDAQQNLYDAVINNEPAAQIKVLKDLRKSQIGVLENAAKAMDDANEAMKTALTAKNTALDEALKSIKAAEASGVDINANPDLKNFKDKVSDVQQENLREQAEVAIRMAQRARHVEEYAIQRAKDAKDTIKNAIDNHITDTSSFINEDVASKHIKNETSAALQAADQAALAAIKAAKDGGVQDDQIQGYAQYQKDIQAVASAKTVASKEESIERIIESLELNHANLAKLDPTLMNKFARETRTIGLLEHFYNKYSPDLTNASLESSRVIMETKARDKEGLRTLIEGIKRNVLISGKDNKPNEAEFWKGVLKLAESIEQRINNLATHQVSVAVHADEAKTVANNDAETELKAMIEKITGKDTPVGPISAEIASGKEQPLTTDSRKADQAIVRVSKVDLPADKYRNEDGTNVIGYKASITSSKQGVTRTKIYLDDTTKAYLGGLPNEGGVPHQKVLNAAQEFVRHHLDDNRRAKITTRNPLVLKLSDLPENLTRAIVLVCLQKYGDVHKLDVRHPKVNAEDITNKQIIQYQKKLNNQSLTDSQEIGVTKALQEAITIADKYLPRSPGKK